MHIDGIDSFDDRVYTSVMKYFSVCSGIAGFELGIKQAYESLSKTERKQQGRNKKNITKHGKSLVGAECIGYSEIDKYAIQIFEKQFPNIKNYGDATKIITSELPDFDLIVGGFPCQSFSIAGKRGGFKDTRGTLFFEIARIIKAKRPRLLCLENVKGLLSHNKGNTFATIITTIDELGYDCQWSVLNSKNFGVPQNRERVFIIGHLRGTSRPKVFPIQKSSEGNLKYSGGVISARERWLKDGKTNSRNFSQGQRIYNKKGIAQTLAGNAGGQGGKTGLYDVDAKIRRLTPTECERLQGFPDGWTEGLSDTQRYKTLGNAVTVNVIKAIFEKILKQSI